MHGGGPTDRRRMDLFLIGHASTTNYVRNRPTYPPTTQGKIKIAAAVEFFSLRSRALMQKEWNKSSGPENYF